MIIAHTEYICVPCIYQLVLDRWQTGELMVPGHKNELNASNSFIQWDAFIFSVRNRDFIHNCSDVAGPTQNYFVETDDKLKESRPAWVDCILNAMPYGPLDET